MARAPIAPFAGALYDGQLSLNIEVNIPSNLKGASFPTKGGLACSVACSAPAMTKTFLDPNSNRKIFDLSREYSELQHLRTQVRNAEAKNNKTRVDHAVEIIMKAEDKDTDSAAREKLANYLDLLVSTDTTDRQLLIFGIAYLNEIREPNSRYSGC
jgi:hypothetical protein